MTGRHRAEQIRAFRDEVRSLEAEGVVALAPEAAANVHRHQEALLAGLGIDGDVDLSREEARLSVGMRIATLLGAIALSAAWAMFVREMWDDLGLVAKLVLVWVPPVLLASLTHFSVSHERSGYVASIVASVASVALLVAIVATWRVYALAPSQHVFLAVGAFALFLAYRYGLGLVLLIGIVGMGGWLWALTAFIQGSRWEDAFDIVEPLLAVGILSFLLPRLLVGGPASFAPIWRAAGAIMGTAALLILGISHHASVFEHTFRPELVETGYQIVGFVAFVSMIGVGLRRDEMILVRTGAVGLVLFLLLRMVDWFWDTIPQWLFFLIVGALAVGSILVMLRVRRQLQARRG